ncbi:hypothetical protein V6N11_061189 [Hibiscus sabdariffa]|uniref:Uncharacterized protein n=1 Tax=Hibiscus sabdariffa TaxID=183260 RepID=A0ABR1ZZT4_9ROSI
MSFTRPPSSLSSPFSLPPTLHSSSADRRVVSRHGGASCFSVHIAVSVCIFLSCLLFDLTNAFSILLAVAAVVVRELRLECVGLSLACGLFAIAWSPQWGYPTARYVDQGVARFVC